MFGNRPWLNTVYKKTCIVNCFQTSLVEVQASFKHHSLKYGSVFRFVPDRGFSGADQAPTRDGPVQFEKDTEEDPFGLNKFLTEAKKAKRPVADRLVPPTVL